MIITICLLAKLDRDTYLKQTHDKRNRQVLRSQQQQLVYLYCTTHCFRAKILALHYELGGRSLPLKSGISPCCKNNCAGVAIVFGVGIIHCLSKLFFYVMWH